MIMMMMMMMVLEYGYNLKNKCCVLKNNVCVHMCVVTMYINVTAYGSKTS
jgi:hypothetical protein